MTTTTDPVRGAPPRLPPGSDDEPRGALRVELGAGFRPLTWRSRPERPLMVLALLIDLATLLLGVVLYDQQPEQVPVGWAPDGAPDRFAPRSPALVLCLPVAGAAAVLLLWRLAATRTARPERCARTVSGWLRAHAAATCSRIALGWAAVLVSVVLAVLSGAAWTADTLPGMVSVTVLLLVGAAAVMARYECCQQNAMVDAELIARRVRPGPLLAAEHRVWRHGVVADAPLDPGILVPGGPFGIAPNVAHGAGTALGVLPVVAVAAGLLVVLFVLPPLSW